MSRDAGTWLRAGLLALLVGAGVVVVATVDLPAVDSARAWLDRSGPAGPLLLTLGVGVALLGPVPRTALSVLAGLVAGFWGGLAISLAGGLLGGIGAFALARLLGRPAVAALAGPRIAATDRFLGTRGFGTVLALRLFPAAPFTVVSYGAGLSAVRPGPYVAATALGLVPSTVLQVGAGASVEHLDRWADLLTAPVATAVAVLVLLAAGGLALWWRRRA
ncbi:TVP38/TMEM64 family protein [Blastococcus sp. URHD0036]|uniref:TVP38/TMEM64 family protein n=1 Tax=Blastococcus sp. URHD0036 TaxID=1380356 RepID=UPI00068AAB69|nr:VTT domain-containing protein [Blastococcus sp. URHD0036]